MKKLFKNFKLGDFIAHFSLIISYPLIKTIITKDNKLLTLSDTLLIMAFVFIIAGVINSFVLHGDLDITSFVAKRISSKNANLSYDKFKKDKENERKGSFNYPLFVGIISIFISYIIAIFV